MGVVESSKGMLKPVSDNLINETQIVCRLAMATLGNRSAVNWHHYAGSYDAIRDAIEKSIPGFENYNVRVRRKGGFYLPNAASDGRFITRTEEHTSELQSLQRISYADFSFKKKRRTIHPTHLNTPTP